MSHQRNLKDKSWWLFNIIMVILIVAIGSILKYFKIL